MIREKLPFSIVPGLLGQQPACLRTMVLKIAAQLGGGDCVLELAHQHCHVVLLDEGLCVTQPPHTTASTGGLHKNRTLPLPLRPQANMLDSGQDHIRLSAESHVVRANRG